MDTKKELRLVLNIFLYAVIILALIGLALFVSYYYLVYLEPNFDNEDINYLKPASSEEVSPEGEIMVELSFGNSGAREVSDFSVEFFIPQYTKLKLSSQPGKYFKEKNSIIFDSKILKKDESSKILITLITDKPLDNGTLIKINDANTSYRLSDETFTGKIKSSAQFRIKSAPEIVLSELKLKDKDGGDINMEDEISFSFNTVNIGDMNATGVQASAIIPPKTKLIESSVIPRGFEIKDRTIVWNLGALEINKPVDFSYSLKVLNGFNDTEKIKGSVSLKSSQGADLLAGAESEVRLFPDLGNSEIFLSDENGEFLWAGDRIQIKALLLNNGERTAEDVWFKCPIPKGSVYVNDSAFSEGAEVSFQDNELLFKIAKIEVGEKKNVVFEVQISPNMTGGGVIRTDFGISAGETEFDLQNSEINIKANYQITVACLGDSLVALSSWPQILDSLLESTYRHSDYNVIASGIRGELAFSGFNRFDSSIAPYKPQILIVGYGTNDIGSGTGKFSQYLSGIVEKGKNINATVFIESIGYINISLAPLKYEWPSYQKVIYQVGASYGVPVIDIYSILASDPGRYVADWVHYTPEGSSAVAHTIYNQVIRYLDSEGRRK
ncbi:MAG: SGNH/GDSL hydrolase family protein [Candidatus Humimicrobiaceae bacterium]